MKIAEWMDTIKSYSALKRLAKKYDQINRDNITLLNLMKAVERNEIVKDIYQTEKVLTEVSKEVGEWILSDVFASSKFVNQQEEKLQILFEKVTMIEEKPSFVERHQKQLEKQETLYPDTFYLKILQKITTGIIDSDKMYILTEKEFVKFYNDHQKMDIWGVLCMKDENRRYYMENYNDKLFFLADYYYTGIQQMKAANFKAMIEMIKTRYAHTEFYQNSYPYDYLETLAEEYGNSEEEVASFVFYAFKDFMDISVRGIKDGQIKEPFKELVQSITTEKSGEELVKSREEYYSFLNRDTLEMKEMCYQTILDPRFIQSDNKEEIMRCLNYDDLETYSLQSEKLLQNEALKNKSLTDYENQYTSEILALEDLRELEEVSNFVFCKNNTCKKS